MPCHERAGKFRWKNISENISSIGSITLKRKKAAFVLSNKMFFSTIELSFTMDLIEKKTWEFGFFHLKSENSNWSPAKLNTYW